MVKNVKLKFTTMKVTIEKNVMLLNNDERNENMLVMFHTIIDRILLSKSKEELKNYFENWSSRYFEIGFGSSHFWVSQKPILEDVKYPIERNIIVEF